MAICKCNTCGADIEFPEGGSVAVCVRCGNMQTVTAPEKPSKEKKARGGGAEPPMWRNPAGTSPSAQQPEPQYPQPPVAESRQNAQYRTFPAAQPRQNVSSVGTGGAGKKNNIAWILAIVAAVLIPCIVLLIVFLPGKKSDPVITPAVSGQADGAAFDGVSLPEQVTGANEENITAAPQSDGESVTAAPQGSNTQSVQPSVEAPSAAPSSYAGWESAASDQLYLPGSGDYTESYTAYVFCIDKEIQDFAKMRMGPSKKKFEVTGNVIPNYDTVLVRSLPINDWCLCEYYGTSGWVRSDFLFRDMNDILALLEDGDKMPGGIYQIDITDPTAGPALNMRDQPAQEGNLLTTIPNGEKLDVPCDAVITKGRVYATGWGEYSQYSGYVLMRYLRYVESGMGDKPVLYLYPEEKTDVDVTVSLAKNVHFTCLYPAYRDGWHVTASPDGTLTDRVTGKEYACLYWELGGSGAYDFSTGFVVKGSDTASFLEDTLTEMGLNPRERNEFIIYWLPKMQNNPYNLISFQTEAYTSLVDLQITPAPDSLLRVFMAYRPLTEPVEIPPQTVTPFERAGFTAVEWGGVECRY